MKVDRDSMDVLEAIATTRSMRRLKTDDVPDSVLHSILEAACCAPTGSNRQSWSFIVIRDHGTKKKLQEYYLAAAQHYWSGAGNVQQVGQVDLESALRVRASAVHLAEHMHEAPVLVLCCIRGEESFELGSSIFPAVQNLMLAARAFGVGSTLTTMHRRYETEIKELLGIPDDVHTAALIPLGYPVGRWARAKRKPLADVVFADRYGDRFFLADIRIDPSKSQP